MSTHPSSFLFLFLFFFKNGVAYGFDNYLFYIFHFFKSQKSEVRSRK